jgi:hypothetical protein
MARPKKSETEAKAPKKAKGHNLVDPETRALFLVHRDKYSELKAKLDKASGTLRAYVKTIKSDGFKLQMVKDSILLSTPEGEAEFKAEMANRMLAAAYSGADIGEQLSLFLDEPRVPAVDRAAKEGQEAAMRNEAHNPPYDPSVPQYKAWSDAFYAEQERQIKSGISKLDAKKAAENAKAGKSGAGKRGRPPGSGKKGANAEPPAGSERTLITKAEKDAKATARAPKADDAPPRRPAAVPATRSSMKASKEAAREEAESYFTRSEPAGNA